MRADGSGLHRIADAGREASFAVDLNCILFGGSDCARQATGFDFSAGGRRLVFTDRGPDTSGTPASQVFVLDLTTGARTQLTSLPPLPRCVTRRSRSGRSPLLNVGRPGPGFERTPTHRATIVAVGPAVRPGSEEGRARNDRFGHHARTGSGDVRRVVMRGAARPETVSVFCGSFRVVSGRSGRCDSDAGPSVLQRIDWIF